MKTELYAGIPSLIGNELSGACFVRDYIELHFDGPILRLLGDVAIQERPGAVARACLQDGESLSTLLAAIGHRVTQAELPVENCFQIAFESGLVVVVRPKEPGYEYVHYLSFPEKSLTIIAGE